MAFFITVIREITNRRGFLLIRSRFLLHLAYYQLIRDRFFNLLHSGRIQPNPANIPNCFFPIS